MRERKHGECKHRERFNKFHNASNIFLEEYVEKDKNMNKSGKEESLKL